MVFKTPQTRRSVGCSGHCKKYLVMALALTLALCWFWKRTPGKIRPAPQEPQATLCRNQPFTTYIRINQDSVALQDAIEEAVPGTLIELMPGVYKRPFKFSATVFQKHAEPGRRIIICGPPEAWVSAEGFPQEGKAPYNFLIQESSFVSLVGFTLHWGLKGLVIDRSMGIEVHQLHIQEIDQEGVSIRHGTTHTVIQDSVVMNTGREDPGYGEGIYVGSSSRFGVDMCINTTIVGNRIGPGVTAECIDVKENTQGGLIRGNVLDGSGMSGEHFGDSWVDIKGTGWVVEGNTGFNTVLDGFQVHALHGFRSGWNNSFSGNTCDMGSAPGSCFQIYCKGTPSGCNNVIKCDNLVLSRHGASAAPYNCTA